ncbi:MAG: CBS domain-containing protein [Gammaproteobacteria bacterium]|nr:CBS domain-containing protein [Gammaproteobacteria bacterium]
MFNLTCKDVMSSEQVVLHPNDTVSKAFQLMRSKGMRFLPVVDEEGKYLGVFTSPTLIKLLLPRAITIEMGGRGTHKGLNSLNFLNLEEEDFCSSLSEIKTEPVINHLSDPKNIPVTPPETPVIEGVLLLHQYKRHVILVEPVTNEFVGVLTINSVLREIFDEKYEL